MYKKIALMIVLLIAVAAVAYAYWPHECEPAVAAPIPLNITYPEATTSPDETRTTYNSIHKPITIYSSNGTVESVDSEQIIKDEGSPSSPDWPDSPKKYSKEVVDNLIQHVKGVQKPEKCECYKYLEIYRRKGTDEAILPIDSGVNAAISEKCYTEKQDTGYIKDILDWCCEYRFYRYYEGCCKCQGE